MIVRSFDGDTLVYCPAHLHSYPSLTATPSLRFRSATGNSTRSTQWVNMVRHISAVTEDEQRLTMQVMCIVTLTQLPRCQCTKHLMDEPEYVLLDPTFQVVRTSPTSCHYMPAAYFCSSTSSKSVRRKLTNRCMSTLLNRVAAVPEPCRGTSSEPMVANA